MGVSILQVDPQATRFLFKYYGKKFSINHFREELKMKSVEGTIDSRGCQYIFMTTEDRHRTSNIISSINEFNQNNPSENSMRLQSDIDQPMIVTMSSKVVKGPIFYQIKEDRRKKHTDYWHWEPEIESLQNPVVINPAIQVCCIMYIIIIF